MEAGAMAASMDGQTISKDHRELALFLQMHYNSDYWTDEERNQFLLENNIERDVYSDVQHIPINIELKL